jgi:hypothetical protein
MAGVMVRRGMRQVLLATLIAIAACGGSKDDKPAPPAKPAAPAQAKPLLQVDPAACALFTTADASALLGHPVSDGVAAHGVVPTCNFRGTVASTGMLSVRVYRERGENALESILGAKLFGATPVEIAGAGTRAIRAADSASLAVLVDQRLVVVTVAGLGKDGGPTPAAAEAVAHTIAGRL